MSHAQNMMTLITAGEDSELKKFDKKKNNSNKNLKINKNKRIKKNTRGEVQYRELRRHYVWESDCFERKQKVTVWYAR